MKSHSQNNEDEFILDIYNKKKIESGFFFEFGAWDGIHLSNCRLLFENGWSGCFVEIDERRFIDLKNNIIISYILYSVPIIILVGVCSHWYKDNKHHFFNKKQERYNDDIDKRLNKLKDLLDKGIIDRQEYEKQREKIINEL